VGGFVARLSASAVFSSYSSGDHRALHSFPTRRSSDLASGAARRRAAAARRRRARPGVRALHASPKNLPAPITPVGEPSHRTRRRSEEHTSELQSRENLVCRLLLEKKNKTTNQTETTDD